MRGKTAGSRIPGKISCARPSRADRTFRGRVAGLPAWEGRYTRGVEFPTSDPSPDMPTNLLSRREVLAETRSSLTHKFSIGGHEGYLTIGLFEDGRPGEIFIKMSKEGSTLSGLIQGFCRAFSLCLQHGLRVEEAVERFRGMRFEPMGPTSNPEIPECSSILDYVARYLEHEFVERA